jgi:hypothetical protein
MENGRLGKVKTAGWRLSPSLHHTMIDARTKQNKRERAEAAMIAAAASRRRWRAKETRTDHGAGERASEHGNGIASLAKQTCLPFSPSIPTVPSYRSSQSPLSSPACTV